MSSRRPYWQPLQTYTLTFSRQSETSSEPVKNKEYEWSTGPGTSFVVWWGQLFGIRNRETICGGNSGVESRSLRTADLWAVKETAPRPPLIDSFNGILTPFVVLHLLNEFGNITCRAGPPRGRLWSIQDSLRVAVRLGLMDGRRRDKMEVVKIRVNWLSGVEFVVKSLFTITYILYL